VFTGRVMDKQVYSVQSAEPVDEGQTTDEIFNDIFERHAGKNSLREELYVERL
jgi:hypothetical protein